HLRSSSPGELWSISRRGDGEQEATLSLAPPGRSDGGREPCSEGRQPLICSVLRFDSNALRHYRHSLGLRSDRTALVALAKAIAISPGWSDQARLSFLVRVEPEPV